MKKKSRVALLFSVLCIAVLLCTTALGDGWQQSNGRWWYSYKNGSYASNKWFKDGNNWYYFDASGWMQTGWMADGGTWYYFGTDGAMKTGWQNIAGSWYYFDKNGAMQTGWVKDGKNWYYLYADGTMATNTVIDGYSIDANGVMGSRAILFADQQVIDLKVGDEAIVWITLLNKSTEGGGVFYRVTDSSVASCSWGVFEGDRIPLTIKGEGGGETTIKITTSRSNDTIIIKVKIPEPWANVKVVALPTFGDSQDHCVRLVDYSFQNYNSKYYTMYVTCEFVKVKPGRTNFGCYCFFYNAKGQIIDKAFIYSSAPAVGERFTDDFEVPIETAKIEFKYN